jgi:hypothetical protein
LEQGKSGTDQTTPDPWANPVYSNMIGGRGAACASAHFYHYPSMNWTTWQTFAFA